MTPPERKGGLGRGLAALIPQGPPPGETNGSNGAVGTLSDSAPSTVVGGNTVAGAVYREVPINEIP